MSELSVRSLHIYPLKGARAADVAAATVEARGLLGDRRLVATDPEGTFLTQRQCGALARISAAWRADTVFLDAGRSVGSLQATAPAGGERRNIVVWNDTVAALPMGEAADAWLASALGRPARLFYMDDGAFRRTSARFAPAAPVSFADAYPVLVATEASLAALNAEIARNGGPAIGMERFRPNIVIDGADPWAEDFWAAIAIGDVVLDLVKPSDRCVVTTTDQLTGARKGKEPLASLGLIRRSADPRVTGVLFGWNAVPRACGRIEVGGGVRILARRDQGWPLEARARPGP